MAHFLIPSITITTTGAVSLLVVPKDGNKPVMELRLQITLLLTVAAGCASASRDVSVLDKPANARQGAPRVASVDDKSAVPEGSQQISSAVRSVSLTSFQSAEAANGELQPPATAPAAAEEAVPVLPDIPEDAKSDEATVVDPLGVESERDESNDVRAANDNDPFVGITTIAFQDVIDSVHQSFPLVEAAYQERNLAAGNQIAAWGAFDTKLKAASENGPLGFYETYRNSAGFTTPIYQGGEFFGGYRNGGGDFQPWYQERETNDGGEFKGGVRVPLIRDREIDSRRAELWRATYDQQIANPVIRASLVEFSREAGLSYWKWVATRQKYELGEQWLKLAEGRNDGIKERVRVGDLPPPEEIDNARAIAKREAKLADSLRELQQAAAKLSLFLRDEQGMPYVADNEQTAAFPSLLNVDLQTLDANILTAQQNRPELQAIDLELQKLRVDYSEAVNMTRPGLDAQIVGSQDMGQPTSKKRDKSEFELEAALFFDVPLQRRKGLGKMQAVQAKIAQVTAKRRMVQDKVAAEVQFAYAGLIQSRQAALKAREAVKLAAQMAAIERESFDAGNSDLLKVALREQYALEAAEEEISAIYQHFAAFTDYEAAVANDRPNVDSL